MELCDHSAVELARMLRAGETTSVEVTRSVLQRIDEREAEINAYITVDREGALRQAQAADERFRGGGRIPALNGIPLAVKDILCTRGIRTTCASRILQAFKATYDATAFRRIMDEGAVLIGKTNLDEFGMGSSTENSVFGPTRNPVDTGLVAGGSSGGSAAAVAAGEAVIALGTDTGGSIRLPGAFCGCVGIKPTYGRVSRFGLIAYASSLDQVGALARTVEDTAFFLNAIAGHDPLDTTSAALPVPDFTAGLGTGVDGLRIGLPREYFVEGLDPRIRECVLGAASLLERNGARIVEVSLPHARYAISAYYLIATAEASSNLARYDGVKYGFRSEEETDLLGMYAATRSQGFGSEVKRRIMLGTYVLSAGYYDAYYRKAQEARTLIKQDFDAAFEGVDCMLAPVSPCLPFKLGEKLDDPLQMYLVDIYTVSLNLSGLPGMSIPCGRVNGLPVGLQIIGRAFDEATILRLGHACETLLGRI
ncbi:Asp-tRNA(Asn)/Glu-tRNA(Gln) amidotransferase subunit GatA [Desulfatiglans anilini]|uniref:Asp-tRNA(Asn)/Glu-tRNA(Gln) amidotransferase subunit GatA n=1 Tax=Desulfatiglans anilini TaxID=90728 RepID=UPI0004115A00|nr:Asp-tRNA(Asn)/Glu-tRNA(Gln) amidotransferase subunit GatA [Desulfatiglans anilini]